jgi:hypothetical protein
MNYIYPALLSLSNSYEPLKFSDNYTKYSAVIRCRSMERKGIMLLANVYRFAGMRHLLLQDHF